MDYSPIILVVISLINVAVTIYKAIRQEKLNKVLFFFFAALFIVTASIGYAKYYQVFEGAIFDQFYFIYMGFMIVMFLVTLYVEGHASMIQANQYQMFMKTLKESKYNIYYVLDRKDRIKDISQLLCEDLNVERKDVLNKKFYQVINESIRISEFNRNPITNKQFERFFQDYRKICQKDDIEKIELTIANYKGEQVLFHLNIQPVFIFNKFRGFTAIGEKKSSWELLEVEKSLNDTSSQLNSVTQKFISILEVTTEGLFEMDLDQKTIWASDELVKNVGLPDNTCDLIDFRKLIDESDRQKYLARIGELTRSNPTYTFSYRLFTGKAFEWFKESGKRIFDDTSSSVIMGSINPVKTKHYQSSNIDILDGLEGKIELLVFMKDLFLKGKYFQLLLFDLANLKMINETHDRSVGNMIMGEYIRKIKQNFVTESGELFRITGTVFALILTNTTKIGVLEKGVRNQNDFLNFQMAYGSLQTTLEVFAGIASSGTDASNETELFECASKALKLTKHERFDAQALYYKDIA